MRWQQLRQGANDYGWVHRPKSPKGKIQLRSLEPDGTKGRKENAEYIADERGNMDVRAAKHIQDFIGLGWPIYNGIFMGDTSVADLLWPNNPEYDRRVLEGLNLRTEV
jgi:hypothetical protein